MWVGFPSHAELWEDNLEMPPRNEVAAALARVTLAGPGGEAVRLLACGAEALGGGGRPAERRRRNRDHPGCLRRHLAARHRADLHRARPGRRLPLQRLGRQIYPGGRRGGGRARSPSAPARRCSCMISSWRAGRWTTTGRARCAHHPPMPAQPQPQPRLARRSPTPRPGPGQGPSARARCCGWRRD